jgi:hypothetical protein
MDRQKKRDSAKKSKNFSVYSKKAVRAKEALIERSSIHSKKHHEQKTMFSVGLKHPGNGPKPENL